MMSRASIAFLILAVVVAVAAQERGADDDLTPFYLIGTVLSFAMWGAIATMGYIKAEWTLPACLLVFLFGMFGLLCTLFMPKRTTVSLFLLSYT
uniref:NADH dehydrogenase subunit 6 n=1 Tax=Plectus sambesii TaxID=2011161 RepID=A0A914VXV7_9BILA